LKTVFAGIPASTDRQPSCQQEEDQECCQSPLVHIKVAYSKADELFLEKVNNTILNNLEDAELDVEKLAKLVNMSRPTLYRKIKSISDLTPNELINITRLKKAAELLVEGNYKIYEIADMTGFGSQTNFGRNFHKQFGMTPTDYLTMKHSNKKE
jgi:AraC-like DNA-binding protein